MKWLLIAIPGLGALLARMVYGSRDPTSNGSGEVKPDSVAVRDNEGNVLSSIETAPLIARELIKELEDYAPEPYYDAKGRYSVGYGHLLTPEEYTSGRFQYVSKSHANQLLLDDMKIAIDAVNRYVKVPLTETQKAALISFVYNVGIGNFVGSTLLRKLNAGDYDGAAKEFPRWVYSDGTRLAGLEKRRQREQDLFMRA